MHVCVWDIVRVFVAYCVIWFPALREHIVPQQQRHLEMLVHSSTRFAQISTYEYLCCYVCVFRMRFLALLSRSVFDSVWIAAGFLVCMFLCLSFSLFLLFWWPLSSSIPLSTSRSASISLYVSFCLSLFVYVSCSVSLCLSACLYSSLSLSFSLYFSVSVYMYLLLSLFVSLSLYLSLSLSIYLSYYASKLSLREVAKWHILGLSSCPS